MKNWFEKMKENPVVLTIFYILLTIVLIAGLIGIKNLLKDKPSSGKIIETEKSVYGKKNLPEPDRILYKVGGEDIFYIWTKEDSGYREILDEIQRAAENLIEGRKLSQEEVENRETNDEWVMLDYDKISKNYFISLENQTSSILKYQTEGAISVKDEIGNIEEIKKEIRKNGNNKKAYHRYDEESNHSYESQNILQEVNYEFVENAQNGIFQTVLENKDSYQKFADSFKVQIDKVIEESLFENNHIVATVSKPKVESIKNNIGNLKYIFSYTKDQGYHVNIYVASRVVNEKCIYKEIQGTPKEDGYVTKEYINIYHVISNSKITDKLANNLNFVKQQDGSYSKIIASKEELKKIGDTLTLKSIGSNSNYLPHIEKVAEWEKNKDYVMVIKNTTGHFEVDSNNLIPGEQRILKNPFIVNAHEIKVNGDEAKIQGTILAVPKEAGITQIQINQEDYDNSKFENNARKITKQKAIQIAKEIIKSNKDDYVAFLDIRSKISSLYGYETTKTDGLRRVWIVCSPSGQNSGNITQVAIDATTGKILDTDEMGC